MWLTIVAIRRPVVLWAALAAVAVLGLTAYYRLPAELNPRVAIPTITIATIYPGAGPEEVESAVSEPLEDALGTVGGLRDVYSRSQESLSVVSMDFRVGTDLGEALPAVRERVDAARALLPPGALPPIVARLDINAQPVLFVGITDGGSASSLRDSVDRILRPQIARVPGVAGVTVLGGESREVRVRADVARLQQLGITVSDLVSSLRAAGEDVPAGAIVRGRSSIAVRTLGAFRSLDDIRQAQILAPPLSAAGFSAPGQPPPPPAPVTVGEVADVELAPVAEESRTRVNGRDSVSVVVTKAPDANTVSVVEAVKGALHRGRTALPFQTQIVYARDDSIVVGEALGDVNATLLLGAVLAMGIVYLFLRDVRGTIIIALALPICILATFGVMYFAGFTLNQMTLLALSLSVGILIDDSIVVLESITRHLSLGEEPAEAAFNGRTEIGFADITTTLVDVVVFVPIAFMGGIVGAFFREFGLTVAAATLFSLVVSFTVTPSMASRWYRRREAAAGTPSRPRGGTAALYAALEGAYRRAIAWSLRHRGLVIGAGAAALTATALAATPFLGMEFLPAADQGQVTVAVEMPPDSSLDATDAAVRRVEDVVSRMPEVASYASTVGEVLGGFGSLPQRGSQYGQVSLRLVDRPSVMQRILGAALPVTGGVRHVDDSTVAARLRRALPVVAGARFTVAAVRSVADVGPPIQVQLRGHDLAALADAGARVRAGLDRIPGIVDADLSLRTGRPELQARIDRVRASAFDVPIAAAAAALRDAIEGNTDTTYAADGTEYPIRVRLGGIDRDSPSDVAGVPVAYGAGSAVVLGDIADLDVGSGPTAIDRVNGQRMVTVTAQLAGALPLGDARTAVEPLLDRVRASGVDVHWGGEAEAIEENIPNFAFALGLAVVLVYLVMASLFNSVLNPFVIMFTLPMALVGALAALALTGETLSLVSMIGVIMLTGLMGRNAILLIDYTATLRARGMARENAVAEAGATRMRPILMTTLTTIFGMLPVALRIGRASELRAPMAIVVIGGLLVSTVLTLVMIPVLYTLFDDARARLAGWRPAGSRARGR